MSTQSIARVPRKHAEAIKAWADGIDVQHRSFMSNGEWRDLEDGAQPNFYGSAEWRVKPEKVYPVTQMTQNEMSIAFCAPNPNSTDAAREALANAALRHAIDADQVVPMAEVQEVARNLNKRRYDRAERALLSAGFEDLGGQEWKPPLGKAPHFIEVHDPKRDMAVAVAVRNAAKWIAAGPYDSTMMLDYARLKCDEIAQIDLSDIIAKVRP